MRWSRLLIPTLRETPAEAETASHQLLLRAGYIRPLAPGLFAHLPLARRSLGKISALVAGELTAAGASPVTAPGASYRDAAASIAKGELRSYKQLPQVWTQLQTTVPQDARPNSGLLYARQSLEQQTVSFAANAAGLDDAFRAIEQAYRRILERCDLPFQTVQNGPDAIQFIVRSDAGASRIAITPSGYASTLETAATHAAPPVAPDSETDAPPEAFHTPGCKSIEDVCAFDGLPPTSHIKTLVLAVDGKPVLALLRGDHQLSEAKFAAAVGATDFRPARPEEILQWMGAAAGSLGPVCVRDIRILADEALRGRRNLIAGANRDDYHLRNVVPGRDFTAEFCDLRQAAEGEISLASNEPLEIVKAIALAGARKLDPRYAQSRGLRVLDEHGKESQLHLGAYEIAIERILCAAVELHHDKDGIALPPSIAPFGVVITPVNWADPAQREAAESLYAEAAQAGLDPLLDDRDERPGVKFKDADLIGIPHRITLGKKLSQGLAEYVNRRTRESADVPLPEAIGRIA